MPCISGNEPQRPLGLSLSGMLTVGRRCGGWKSCEISMMRMFKYIYYRINRFYFKWDGRRGATALVGLSFSQISWVFVFFILLYKFYFKNYQLADKEPGKFVFYGISILLIYINYRLHDGRYNEYRRIWSSETKSQFYIRGFLVILYIVLPLILFPILINHI